MKLYSLSVLYKGEPKAVLLKAAYDVSSFSFFQRSSVQEFMTFTSQLIVERSAKGSRASVKEQEYLCHVYVRNDSLAGVVIADSEYPSRVAFTLLEKVLDEFSKQVDRIEWPIGSPASIHYTALDGHLSRYQNPREADPMTKVQAELDETKIILHNTMESLLERGEKLDDLVSKSEVLGTQSKAFYKTVSAGCPRELCPGGAVRTFSDVWGEQRGWPRSSSSGGSLGHCGSCGGQNSFHPAPGCSPMPRASPHSCCLLRRPPVFPERPFRLLFPSDRVVGWSGQWQGCSHTLAFL
uniref:Synaptobrevin homolog YKT6 n=1 Tax=Canis lupus familiaris TaxID=9615 RepID=A0A8C0MEI8_CANLF